MEIRPATYDDIDALAVLFDAYRQFYGQPCDMAGAATFLRARLDHQQSTIFVAAVGAAASETLIGFTQLYPSFSSTRMAPIFILNDLFVTPDARQQGTASALLRAAADFARTQGALRLTLSTAHDNLAAQALYEREGWTRDTAFRTYNLPLA
ncbi:GNAT family N-acetyltransferase [Sphingopyxis yananensis]|uniref:GNAT family N-acetyltransferase n=1 Tax=Sphingopyxis yananensis TaxID=2886687 RepID=UPI001D129675|nr:GNAT family N-acetyltransferase [Sphingopyxis yananensis]MCC2602816.1 GNAT family N-acetyltransferase [Sphingopyxis yananensis]